MSAVGLEYHAVLVTGDFNCSPESACSAFLAFGSVMPGVIEYGREVAAEVTQVAAHSHSLESVQSGNKAVVWSVTCNVSQNLCLNA